MDRFTGGRWRRASLGLVMLFSMAGPGWAQLPRECRHDSTSQACAVNAAGAIHIQSPLVILPITVTDRTGNFVLTLKKTEFQVLDDDSPQKIESFSLRMEPVAAVIVVQTDAGVAPLLNAIHPLAILFSNLLLGPAGEAAVITYANKVRVIQSFSSDPATLERSLKVITASGGKARLDDALLRAIQMLANQTEAKRRIIIVCSDGFDSGSKTGRLEVIREATDGGVSIYGLRFDPTYEIWKQNDSTGPSQNAPNYGAMSGNPSEAMAGSSGGGDILAPAVIALELGRSALRRNALQQYAQFTGGVVYKHWKGQTLQDQLQKIALEINSQYTLTYVPNTLNKAGFHPIRVEVSKSGLEVRTRAGYFYAPAAKNLTAN
jgi:VWFA-related protein